MQGGFSAHHSKPKEEHSNILLATFAGLREGRGGGLEGLGTRLTYSEKHRWRDYRPSSLISRALSIVFNSHVKAEEASASSVSLMVRP